VTAYRDDASGVMAVNPNGSGAFTAATLRPRVTLASQSDPVRAQGLHEDAHRHCFIAASVNFPVHVEPQIESPVDPE